MSLDFATDSDGRLVLGPDGDLATLEDDAAVRAGLLRAFETEPGEIPYFPDDGAGAPSHEGGPAVMGDELARRMLATARRDPDVLEASAAQVVRAPTGVTVCSCRVRTRFTPQAAQTVALPLPTR